MPLFSRISRSIQDRVSDNPDGALAKYVWLWQSMGKRPGRRLIPRPIRFFFVTSLDVFSLVGWYVRTGILRVAASVGSKEAIMNLARSKRVAGLTILAGGVLGASLTFGFLGSRSDAVPAHNPVVAASVTTEDRIEVVPVEIAPHPRWTLFCPDTCRERPWVYMRLPLRKDGIVDLSFRPDVESQERALFYIDGVRFGSSDLSMDWRTVESVETVRGNAAVALYGEEAFAGVVLISLKENLPQG